LVDIIRKEDNPGRTGADSRIKTTFEERGVTEVGLATAGRSRGGGEPEIPVNKATRGSGLAVMLLMAGWNIGR
jgi:hypothetical protein